MGQSSSKEEDPILRKKREMILEEILQTERNYVNYLSVIFEVFMEPLKLKNIVKDEDIKQIFINIEGILSFHQEFFRELALSYNSFNWTNEISPITPTTTKTTVNATTRSNRKTTIVTTTTTTMLNQQTQKHDITSLESTKEITEIFNQSLENFKMYSLYIIGYDSSITTLKRLKKKNAFSTFLNKQQSDTRCNGLDLLSLLIMPVQRLPRYVLLLTEILKISPENHQISKLLAKCVQGIKDVTLFINEAKRDDENHSKLLSLQDTLVDKVSLLDSGRKLFMDGECFVHSIYPIKEEDALLKKIRKARSSSKQSDKDKFTESFVFPSQFKVSIQMNYYLFNDCFVFLYQKPQKSSFSISKRIWYLANVSITEKLRFIDVLDIFTLSNSILVITEKSIYFIQMKPQEKEKFIKIFQMSKMDWGTYNNDKDDKDSSTTLQNNQNDLLPSILSLRYREDPFLLSRNDDDINLNNSTNPTSSSKSSFFSLSSSSKEPTTNTTTTTTSGLTDHKRKQSVAVPPVTKKDDINTTVSKGKSKSMFFK